MEDISKNRLDFYMILPVASLLGLIPHSRNVYINRFLITYSVLLHVTYRLFNVFVLICYIRYSMGGETGRQALTLLLIIVGVGKGACPALHIYNVCINQAKFSELIKPYRNADFRKNTYIRASYVGLLVIPLPLFLRPTTDISWQNLTYALCGTIDSLNVYNIAMQYCTCIDLIRKKFAALVIMLASKNLKIDVIVDKHDNLIAFASFTHALFEKTLLLMGCYLGLDFIVALFDVIESFASRKAYLWSACTAVYALICLLIVFLLCKTCEDTKHAVTFK